MFEWLTNLLMCPAKLAEVNSKLDVANSKLGSSIEELDQTKNKLADEESKSETYKASADEALRDLAAARAELDIHKKVVNEAIMLPKILDYAPLSDKQLVDPWIMTNAQWKGVRPDLLSDLSYYAFPEETWMNILTPIQAEVKKKLGFPKSEINDCDNWTLTMCAFIAIAFRDAGLDKQGAFLKLISKPHSYCGFMLPDYKIRVYEPMSGKVVGWLGETGPGDFGADTYKTEIAYFLA